MRELFAGVRRGQSAEGYGDALDDVSTNLELHGLELHGLEAQHD